MFAGKGHGYASTDAPCPQNYFAVLKLPLPYARISVIPVRISHSDHAM